MNHYSQGAECNVKKLICSCGGARIVFRVDVTREIRVVLSTLRESLALLRCLKTTVFLR